MNIKSSIHTQQHFLNNHIKREKRGTGFEKHTVFSVFMQRQRFRDFLVCQGRIENRFTKSASLFSSNFSFMIFMISFLKS